MTFAALTVSACGGDGDGGAGSGGTTGMPVPLPPPPPGATPDAGAGGAGPAHGGADAAPTVGMDGGGVDAGLPLASELTVVSVEPVARTITAERTAPIVVRFDRPLDPTTVTGASFWAFGRWSGPVRDAGALSDGDRVVTLTPARPWVAGDRVTVILSNALRGADGVGLRGAGYSFQFSTRTAPAAKAFTEIDRMTTRSVPSTTTRSYGGSAVDLDGNGYLDLMIVNEDSGDLRIFMSKGDGSGTFDPFVKPPTPLDQRASPSEPTDFDGDGVVDLVTANLDAANLSILLGKGDGTFEPTQKLAVGFEPRGVAVIDVDGDGDVDVVNTNRNSSNLSILINDGKGTFTAPSGACPDAPGTSCFFDAGSPTRSVDQEFGLFAGDMNEDGILDLVIGDRMTGGTIVNTGNGDGTFSFASAAGPDTDPWQLVVGDFDGDGHEDVATANSDGNTATLLKGDGAGGLAVLEHVNADGFPFAIDAGDLDGDGDLDVVVSNFAGRWQVFENDGAGALTLHDTVAPQNAASCALLIDLDDDADLDLALIDETADEVILLRN